MPGFQRSEWSLADKLIVNTWGVSKTLRFRTFAATYVATATVQVGSWGRPLVCRLSGPPARMSTPLGPRSRRLRGPADQRSAPPSHLNSYDF